jgi:hypothetical protein
VHQYPKGLFFFNFGFFLTINKFLLRKKPIFNSSSKYFSTHCICERMQIGKNINIKNHANVTWNNEITI